MLMTESSHACACRSRGDTKCGATLSTNSLLATHRHEAPDVAVQLLPHRAALALSACIEQGADAADELLQHMHTHGQEHNIITRA